MLIAHHHYFWCCGKLTRFTNCSSNREEHIFYIERLMLLFCMFKCCKFKYLLCLKKREIYYYSHYIWFCKFIIALLSLLQYCGCCPSTKFDLIMQCMVRWLPGAKTGETLLLNFWATRSILEYPRVGLVMSSVPLVEGGGKVRRPRTRNQPIDMHKMQW